MIITYFRSSSYNTWSMCPMQYYIQYVLSWQDESGLKASKGTIVHKNLEILANLKKAKQDGLKQIEDEICGTLNVNYIDINVMCDQVYDYYSKFYTHLTWTEKDRKDCKNWTWKALQLNSGMFDPRKRNIFASELRFDFEIDKDWAKYEYELNGEQLSGQLALKGTIDLITQEEGMLEIIDWKSGRRLNWGTGEEKTHAKLQDDPQLRLYHYAIHKLYPEVEQVMVTIFFINDGGPFTVCFSKEDLPKTEEMIKSRFELIKKTELPRLNKSWMCTKLCGAGKTSYEGTHIKPIIETRNGQVCKKGDVMTKCEQTLLTIKEQGIQKTTEQYMNPLYTIGHYRPPGST